MASGLKINSYFICFFCSVSLWALWEAPAFAKEAIGWHWYNEIYHEENKEKKEQENDKRESSMVQMALLRQAVREAKARAILYPTVENMRTYLIMQNFVTNQASLFTRAWKKTLLEYPELDYSILHPTQNNAQHIIYAENSRKEKDAIKFFSEKYGLFFFYRGGNPLDQALAPIIHGFSKENNISLIPITVDGKLINTFEANHTNSGQAEKLGVKYFPALILVDPKNQKVIPLHYGFISDSELHRRFLQVATAFKEGV
ncbi:MAG: type-F conjugative transfer system pilin assembly protein TraF [bacterium]